jgi:two-component system, cell cycle sensor histidine kinase and response regulator CckA
MTGSNGGEEHAVSHPGSCPLGEAEAMTSVSRANGSPWSPQPQPLERAFVEMVDTLQKREVELHAAEERYRSMVEAIPALVYAVRPDAAFSTTYISPYVETLFGVAAADWVADPNSWSHRIHPEDRERVVTEWRRRIADRGPSACEYRMTAADGRVLWVRDTRTPARDCEGRVRDIRGFLVDITEQRRVEDQLRQSQKLEAIGRLAGGITHDFNNVLTIITGYSDLLLDRIPADSNLREAVSEINSAGYRAATLTRQLLSFSRKQECQPALIDLNGVVSNLEGMLRRLIGEDVELHITPNATLATVCADRGQVEQILVNLAANARDAMPAGGLLTIETQNLELDGTFSRMHAGVRPGSYVLLAVTDTGAGMDEETKSHLFEPFFTTKERGRGTGLGLSIVYGIVKQAGGHIWVYSEPGRGSCFKIYIPQVNCLAPESVAPPPAPERDGSGETVLVVEDEDRVLDLVSQVLWNHGFRVLQAREGAAAIALTRDFKGAIDVMLTDSVMPYMSGRELARRLSSLRPEMKVLYMSGYTEGAVAKSGMLDGEERDFIQKPFSAVALVRKIRALLDAPVAKGG